MDHVCSYHDNSHYFHFALQDLLSKYPENLMFISADIYHCNDCDFIALIMVDCPFFADDFEYDYIALWVIPYLWSHQDRLYGSNLSY